MGVVLLDELELVVLVVLEDDDELEFLAGALNTPGGDSQPRQRIGIGGTGNQIDGLTGIGRDLERLRIVGEAHAGLARAAQLAIDLGDQRIQCVIRTDGDGGRARRGPFDLDLERVARAQAWFAT